MTRERLQQICTTLAHNPRQADAFVNELIGAVLQLLQAEADLRQKLAARDAEVRS